MDRTREGDRDAYSTLVARYQGHVYGLAYSLAGNWADAQDIAQETFIRAYVNLDQLRDPARFAPWLRRVTFGVAMNWLKAFRAGFFQQIEEQVDLDSLEIPDFAPGPAEVVEKRELADAVQRAIASLPPKYRVPLTMFHLDGLSYQKVAQFMDIPLGTVQSLIHRARAKLRVALAAYAAEEVSPMVQEVFNEHKLPPEFSRDLWRLCMDWLYTGDKNACGEPIVKKPDHAEAHYNLGSAYRNLGHHQEAAEAFREAIRVRPDLAEAHCYLGGAMGKLGRHREAAEVFKEAIRLQPGFAGAHMSLAA